MARVFDAIAPGTSKQFPCRAVGAGRASRPSISQNPQRVVSGCRGFPILACLLHATIFLLKNAALLSPQEQQQTLGEYLSDCRRTLPAEEVKILSGCIDRLVETKRTRFAHDRRKITNCTFGDFANHRHLEVGYTLE